MQNHRALSPVEVNIVQCRFCGGGSNTSQCALLCVLQCCRGWGDMSKCRVLLSHMFCPIQSVTQSPSQSLSQNHVCYLDDNDDGRSASNSSRSFALIKLAISQKLGMRWSISCPRVESVILLFRVKWVIILELLLQYILWYSGANWKVYEYWFMKQKCQVQMVITHCKNAAKPLITRGINATHQHFHMR